MAHKEQLNFLTELSKIISREKKLSEINILEIGSYEVNASIRDIFKGANYLGIDLLNGPGVDLVMNGENIRKLNQKFDIIISSECFEHAFNWEKVFFAMIDCVKDNGYINVSKNVKLQLKREINFGLNKLSIYQKFSKNCKIWSLNSMEVLNVDVVTSRPCMSNTGLTVVRPPRPRRRRP